MADENTQSKVKNKTKANKINHTTTVNKSTSKSISSKLKKNTVSSSKKVTISIDILLYSELEDYLKQKGCSREEFIKKAIIEKLSRDKISEMIDTIIR